ncbi:MAG TPA: 16S rRNA (uracil(1498)-N(3))-methyltransferase [Micromonosporaceae bacterium]
MTAALFLVDALPPAEQFASAGTAPAGDLAATGPDGGQFTLGGPEGHHAATVQRVRPGEVVLLSDGRGGLATAVVRSVSRGRVELRIEQIRVEPAPAPRMVVAQGIAKGERGELAVQAMTEVGVDAIVPWAASRSVAQWRGERGERSWQRWQATAREAAKQARRAWLPEVTEPESTNRLSARIANSGGAFVLHEEASDRLSSVVLPDAAELVLVVGPEGGITPEELAVFTAAGARPVRLGPGVLRTSTAGVAALALLSARLGRW